VKEDEGKAVDFSARWTECRSSVNQAEVNGEALNTFRRRHIRIRETAGICHSDRGTSVAGGRTTRTSAASLLPPEARRAIRKARFLRG